MNGFLFIGDLFINTSAPGRRIDPDFFSVVKRKLEFSLNLAKDKNLVPVIAGQMFYKTFDIKALTEIILTIKDKGIICLPSKMEWDKKRSVLLSKSTIGILSATGIVRTLLPNDIFTLNIDNKEYHLSSRLDSLDEVRSGTKMLVLRNSEMDDVEKFSSYIDTNRVDLCINAGTKFKNIFSIGDCVWNNIGPVVRAYPENEEFQPSVTEWTPSGGFKSYVVPYEKHVMDHSVLAKNVENQNLVQSDFAKLMKDEMIKLQQENDADLIDTELTDILIQTGASPLVRNHISALRKEIEVE